MKMIMVKIPLTHKIDS